MAERGFQWIPISTAHELRRDFCDFLLMASPTGMCADRLYEFIGDTPLDALWSRNAPAVVAEVRRRIADLRPRARGGVLAARSALHKLENELVAKDRLGAVVRALLRGEILEASDHLVLAFDDRQRACLGWVGDWLDTRSLLERLKRLADATVPVLIYGETGTGKEMVARGVHVLGRRRDRPYLAINCAELPESIVESELFGHARGAFTGAASDRAGLFEAAADGTVFLDEIGELALPTQAKLLRLLEEHCVRRVGSSQQRPLACRVAAATNRDLALEIGHRRFRTDLFYRLRGAEIRLSPLRERREDILPLAELFAARTAVRTGGAAFALAADAQLALLAHPWPGNIRELRHAIEIALLATADERIESHHLGLVSTSVHAPPPPEPLLTAKAVERAHILRALASTAGNKMAAARLLGLSRQSLHRRMLRHGISLPAALGQPEPHATPDTGGASISKPPRIKQIP